MRTTFLILSFAFAILAMAQIPAKENAMENYSIIQKPTMAVMGIECRTSNDPEKGLVDIPKHWDRFFRDNIFEQIPNKAADEIIALYCDYEGDYTMPYSLVIGCAVSSWDSIPEGMVVKEVPAGTFALFSAVGEHPKALIETWGKIWKIGLKRTYTGDFELYGAKFVCQNPKEVEVYIAIEGSVSDGD